MKNLSKEKRLLAEFTNLLEIRDGSYDLERYLSNLIIVARKRNVDPMFRISLQGVFLCLRSSIALMNNELYSGRFRDVEPSSQFSQSDELPF